MTIGDAIAAYENTSLIPWVPLIIAGVLFVTIIGVLSRSDGHGGWKSETNGKLKSFLLWGSAVGLLVALAVAANNALNNSLERREAFDQSVQAELTDTYQVTDTSIVNPDAGLFSDDYRTWQQRLTGESASAPAEIGVITDEGTHYTYQVTYRDEELTLHNHQGQPDPEQLRR